MSRLFQVCAVLLLLAAAAPLLAQEEDVALGDVARSFRKPKPADGVVIDNDNLPVMMDKAEAERLEGKPVFSIDPAGKAFRMTSPDGSCSLSFDAKATPLISTPYVSTNLPEDELLKLDGEASIHEGVLQVGLRNATTWELKEIAVAVTVLQDSGPVILQSATLSLPPEVTAGRKSPDTTFLYHLKPAGVSDTTLLFSGNLGDDLSQAKNWHWALVGARGIPPAAPGSVAQPSPSLSASPALSPASALPLPNVPAVPAVNATGSTLSSPATSPQR